MNPTDLLPDIIRSIAVQLPVLLACMVACVLMIARWRVLRRAAPLGLCGFLLALLLSLASPVLWTVLPAIMRERSPAEFLSVYSIVGGVQAFLWAVALVFLLLAVLSGRDRTVPVSR